MKDILTVLMCGDSQPNSSQVVDHFQAFSIRKAADKIKRLTHDIFSRTSPAISAVVGQTGALLSVRFMIPPFLLIV